MSEDGEGSDRGDSEPLFVSATEEANDKSEPSEDTVSDGNPSGPSQSSARSNQESTGDTRGNPAGNSHDIREATVTNGRIAGTDVTAAGLALHCVPEGIGFNPDGPIPYALERSTASEGRNSMQFRVSDKSKKLINRTRRSYIDSAGYDVSKTDFYEALIISGLSNMGDVDDILKTWGVHKL